MSVPRTAQDLPGEQQAGLSPSGIVEGTRIWIVPTLATYEALNLMRTPLMQARFRRPEMAYVDPSTRAWWNGFRVDSPAPANPRQAERVASTRFLVASAAARGIRDDPGILAPR